MNIIGAGGGALEWVRREFYREMDPSSFYSHHLPDVMQEAQTSVTLVPFFAGDRTSFEPRSAAFSGITLAHSRDDLLRATAGAIVGEMRRRYDYYLMHWKPSGKMRYTGGGIEAMLRLKQETFPGLSWEEAPDATISGAAQLAWAAAGTAPAAPFA
jgi:sugar (pentulose or hexulose) kinase